MRRVIYMAILILLNYVLQSTILVRFSILGVTLDTAIILIVSYGILRGDVEGAIFGFFVGLTHDFFGSPFIGLHAMLGMAVGFVAGKPFKDYFKDNYLLPLAMVVVATIAYHFAFFFINFLLGFRSAVNFWFYLRSIIFPKTIYTASMAIPLYSLLYVINRKIETFENDNRNLFAE